MSLEPVIKFLTDNRDKIAVGLIIAVGAEIILRLIFRGTKNKEKVSPPETGTTAMATTRDESPQQIATGDGATQTQTIDRSQKNVSSVNATVIYAEQGSTVNINFPAIDYMDGINESPVPDVRRYFEQGREHSSKREFQKAIEMFEKSLRFEKEDERMGALNIQIGNCYYEMRQYIKASNYYAEAKRAAEKADDERGMGAASVGIGNTYTLRPASPAHRGENVRKAVENYERALKLLSEDEYPIQYATTQNNLGAAYWNLPAADNKVRAENIIKAIECYKEALQISRKEEHPLQYAITQNNLGAAYTDLPAADNVERADNINKAIDCYDEALQIYRKDEYPLDYAMTQNNLGNAYRNLPAATSEERADNVKKAIECYDKALQIRRKEEYPIQYATTQNNLGNAYAYLPAADNEERADNVKKAIDCYDEALQIYRKDEYPQDYCLTAANMGLLLASMGNKEGCRWLREAYELREFLTDQGEGVKEAMEGFCD